jgi:hypothetical protein
MQSHRLEVVRQTKLDIAQWITAGIANCRNPHTALIFARYAAAQLELAALIPCSPVTRKRPATISLLRKELKGVAISSTAECVATLTRVSLTVVSMLAGQSSRERALAMRDMNTARLIRREMETARLLREILPKRAVA